MLIIEGSDLVGKSTLVAQLIQELNDIGFPHIPLHLSKLPDSFHPVKDYLPLMSKNVVWDRFFLSRQAYGTVFRNQHVNSAIAVHYLYSHLVQVPTMTIILTPPDEVIQERWGREEMYDLEGVLRVNVWFRNVRTHKYPNTYSLFQVPTSDDVDSIIKQYRLLRKEHDEIT